MRLKGLLGNAFTSITSIYNQLNGLIIPSDYTSDISNLFYSLLTLDEVNYTALQDQINAI